MSDTTSLNGQLFFCTVLIINHYGPAWQRLWLNTSMRMQSLDAVLLYVHVTPTVLMSSLMYARDRRQMTCMNQASSMDGLSALEGVPNIFFKGHC